MEIWDSLLQTESMITGPWCIGGDFNIILNPCEKGGGRPHRVSKSFDFAACMDSCGVTDTGFVGSTFTWCNNWTPRGRIWKRLDRIMVNDGWLHEFQSTVVRHLSKSGSDHRPLLMKCHIEQKEFVKFF